MPHLFLSYAFYDEVQCIAKVVDGYNVVVGACKNVEASSSRLTSLPQVMVELLFLWPRKKLHHRHNNCTCYNDDEHIPSQKC